MEFGGPDLEPRRLRDLLQSHVDGAPPGSRIDWATYYFRDGALAEALIRASDRGVKVCLALEPDPRRVGANDAVIAMLQAHGLNGGLHLYHPAPFDDGHLHAKIYAFSDPDIAWVGSFNPSGDEPEDAEVVAEIGDQDRGHNLLLGIERPALTEALRRHVQILAGWRPIPAKLRPHFNLSVTDGSTRLYFYPRLRPQIAELEVGTAKAGGQVPRGNLASEGRSIRSEASEGGGARRQCRAARPRYRAPGALRSGRAPVSSRRARHSGAPPRGLADARQVPAG